MEVKRLSSHYYEEMKQLFVAVFSAEPWNDKWVDDAQVDSYLKDLTDYGNTLSFVLVDESDTVVGGAIGYVSNWWEGREYYIKEFFIKGSEQEKGLGSLFLNEMSEHLKRSDIEYVTLMTDYSVPAFSFYKKNGFKESTDTAFMFRRVPD